ncbi:MAG: single-stranded-DNA-specific exonuclease RecJ [bacterium]|nr:single-stranded-DNA-specific exonuclease RecJ [bacterium]
MAKEWIIPPPWGHCSEAAQRWGVAPLIAQLLYNRGLTLGDDPRTFIDPPLKALIPPERLGGAPEAAQRIAAAVRDGRQILIYGDYDVDGITAIAILWQLLKLAGSPARFYVPHRTDEGYGLNEDAIRSIASEGTDVVVTVDCGVTACGVAQLAGELGLELIITDHHAPGPELPRAAAVVHPTIGGDNPNPDLCGAGVAFKLAWAVAQVLSGGERVTPEYRQFLMQTALPLAALGTVADIVSLVGENRIIVRHGLAALPTAPLPGVQALIESAGLARSSIDGYDVGFKLAPRLNAAGRMGHARLAVELFTRADENRAREIALYLEDHNRARQATERKTTRAALKMIEQAGLDGDANRAVVVAGEGWHAGVIGLVASRIVDRLHRPAVVIALDNGQGQGSGRSIERLNLHDALRACREHLAEFGGHAMAAGLKILPDKVDAFTEAFIAHANQTLSAADLAPKLRLDAEVALSTLDLETAGTITRLGPFGPGNPRPLLATDWIELAAEPRCVGKSGDHLQATFTQGGVVVKAIAFGQANELDSLKEHRRCRVAFEPIINDFNGRRTVEMQVVNFKFPE